MPLLSLINYESLGNHTKLREAEPSISHVGLMVCIHGTGETHEHLVVITVSFDVQSDSVEMFYVDLSKELENQEGCHLPF